MSDDFQPRQPKGIPVGGQWAHRSHEESEASLGKTPDRSGQPVQVRRPLATHELDRFYGDAARHDALEQRGYVPATYFAALTDPRSTARRKEWWDQAFLAAEHAADGEAGYPKIPDDYTPSGTAGQALSGKRRGHRMSYTAGDVTLRMPSVTSIKRFAKEEYVNGSFDVPITASDSSGRAIELWVRVTNNGAGVWSVRGLGLEEGSATNAKIAEAVSSVLEARRPTRDPRTVGDLLEAHKQRLARQGDEAQPVRSQWISAVGYSQDAGVMYTKTSNGRTYGHHVDRAVFERVRGNRSPGAAFNALVKGSPAVQVSSCSHCGRFYAEGKGHTCAAISVPATRPTAANAIQRHAAASIASRARRLLRRPEREVD